MWFHLRLFSLSFLHVLLCRCCVAICRFAGTVGAIVTCPLEVVKTRLQSSSSQFYPPRMTEVGRTHNTNGQIKASAQRRDLCTSILRKRSQVSVHAPVECDRVRVHHNFISFFFLQILTISHCGISSTTQSFSIWQCLKWVLIFRRLQYGYLLIVGIFPSPDI